MTAGAPDLIAYCDGGARGNPGPAALGVSIQTPDGEEVVAVGEAIGTATNNVAEYQAVLRALERCRELGARVLLVRSDSKLIVEQLSGRWKIKHAGLRPLAAAVKEAEGAFARVTYEHVYREGNVRADELVNIALDEGLHESGPPAGWTVPGQGTLEV